MTLMKITVNKSEGSYMIHLKGELDASTSILVDRAIDKALKLSISELWINCENLRYISSTGLGVFMSYIAILKERQITLKICGMNARVHNVFNILGLDQIIEVA